MAFQVPSNLSSELRDGVLVILASIATKALQTISNSAITNCLTPSLTSVLSLVAGNSIPVYVAWKHTTSPCTSISSTNAMVVGRSIAENLPSDCIRGPAVLPVESTKQP